MIRLTQWNPPYEPVPGDLSIDPQAVLSVTEYRDNGKPIARVRFENNAYFDVCDFKRDVAERISLAQSCGVVDMERHQP